MNVFISNTFMYIRDYIIERIYKLCEIKKFYFVINRIREKYKNNKKIVVLFIVIHSSVWQYDDLYKKYENNSHYYPVIVVAPYIIYGEKNMIEEMKNTYEYFKKRKLNVYKSYDEKTLQFKDIKNDIKPDIVFFTNPHAITIDKYLIKNFNNDSLTCYVPYGIMSANLQESQYNQKFHNIIWRNFYETKIHYEMARRYSTNKASNVVITGYPKCDVFLSNSYIPKNLWKIKDNNHKKIIWAPHHTIEENETALSYSNFLNYYQFFLDLANRYKHNVQIIFKPHPILLTKLKKHPGWGEKKVNDYCLKWKQGENTDIIIDDYIDIFLTSDGLVLDSISYLTEYMYTEKPIIFMLKDKKTITKFNEFGKEVLKKVYKTSSKNELLRLINKIIFLGNDPMRNKRRHFKNKYLIPQSSYFASDNIYNYIEKQYI